MKLLVKRAILLSQIIKFFDTSALLAGYKLNMEDTNIISNIVFQELEHIKISQNKDEFIKYKARSLIRYLMKHQELWRAECTEWCKVEKLLSKSHTLQNNNDSLLICEARLIAKNSQPIQFITSDASQYLLAKAFKELEAIFYKETQHKEDLWCGYKDLWFDEDTSDELASLYEHPESNVFGLEVNEYAFIHLEGELTDIIKWTGKQYEVIKYKNQNSDFFGKIEPRNNQQKLFFDLLQNRDIGIKLVRGQYGSGKTFLALVHAINYIKWHKFDRIVYIRNNIEVFGSQKLGALPGEEYDKLLPWMMPLADILGDEEALRQLVDEKSVVPMHLGYIRGRSFNNAIIFVDEAENLTTDNVKLILGRAGTNSEVWFLGDESQTDSDIFRKNSGIASLINSLKGDEHFGTVELQKSERGVIAQLAAKIKEA